MSEERCVCCGAIIPEGRQSCPNCLVCSVPPARKYPLGSWVKYKVNNQYFYSTVFSSYFDADGTFMHMYSLNIIDHNMLANEHNKRSRLYREDMLEPVSEEDFQRLVTAQHEGKLIWQHPGGWVIVNEEAPTNGSSTIQA